MSKRLVYWRQGDKKCLGLSAVRVGHTQKHLVRSPKPFSTRPHLEPRWLQRVFSASLQRRPHRPKM